MLKRIHHIGVAVANMESARGVVEQQLGLEVTRSHRAADGSSDAVFYRCGEVEIELLYFKESERRSAWLAGTEQARIEHIAIEVDDLEKTASALSALGIRSHAPVRGPLGISARTDPATSGGIVYQLLQKD
jgi:methylmalonyl-CoA/ethylmalonyl-CoA epimerase